VFTARYGLIPYVKQITFRLLKVKQDGIRTCSKGIFKKNKALWGGCQQWAALLFRKKMQVRKWYNENLLNFSRLFTFSADFQAIFQKLTCNLVKFTTNKPFYIGHIFLGKLQRMGRNIKKKGGSLNMSEDDFSEESEAAKILMIEEIQFLASQRKIH
jgi:UV DNA damage repair endonuclease